MVMDEQTYYFKGTSPFILKEANGTTHEIKQPSMPKANLTFVPVSITDKTECPGGLKEVIGACPYTGTDWYADPNHKCQQRTTGAQNWEAYIKDSRDNQIYRITQFSDANWWFADDLNVAAKSVGTCSGKRYYDPQDRPACPTGWLLPTLSQMCARWATFAKTGSDEYGAPITVGTYWLFETSPDCMSWVGCNVDRWDYVVSDQSTSTFQAFCNLNICTHVGGRVRCFRQL
jgi:hypothetical protein